MIATDGSETSLKAASLAIGIARMSGGSITAVYVVDIRRASQLPGYSSYPGIADRLLAVMTTEGDEATSEIEHEAAHSMVPCEKAILRGIPSDEILRFSSDGGYDLLVMGSVGRTGIDRFLLGSVSGKVVQHSSVPTLVVPAG
jgi:nucleotide-binding universal stress UspA family protein